MRGGAKIYGVLLDRDLLQSGRPVADPRRRAGFLQLCEAVQPRPNFWYQDAGVKPWIYYEQYDNWQDTYGADAVKVFYHSGHGGMGGDGVFYLPMGADWGGLGCTATSNNMRLGNENPALPVLVDLPFAAIHRRHVAHPHMGRRQPRLAG